MNYQDIRKGCTYSIGTRGQQVGINVTGKERKNGRCIVRYDYIDYCFMGCKKGLTYSYNGTFDNITTV